MKSWLQRLGTRGRRTVSIRVARRVVPLRNEAPLISFTFDDFPRSALREGGAILSSHGIRGTFFASFGLMGHTGPAGEMFQRDDLDQLLVEQHELACHTYDHCHAWDTSASEFQASIVRNRQALHQYLPGASFRSFSYPRSCPRPAIKRQISGQFDCCRGGGHTLNAGFVDLNFAKACFLERCDFDCVAELIEKNNLVRGWLIFATHDVRNMPSRFGCAPDFFERVVRQASNSGAGVVTVREAVTRIRGSTGSIASSASRSHCERVGLRV